jgi:hypothetical protein
MHDDHCTQRSSDDSGWLRSIADHDHDDAIRRSRHGGVRVH